MSRSACPQPKYCYDGGVAVKSICRLFTLGMVTLVVFAMYAECVPVIDDELMVIYFLEIYYLEPPCT